MPKTKVQKEGLFAKYKEVVDKSNFVVVELNNVPANVLTNLRKQLAAVDSSLMIVKDKVFTKAAAEEKAMDGIVLAGPLAVLDGGRDIVTALKAFDNAVKDAKSVLSLSGIDDATVAKYVPFTFKLGVINHSFLDTNDTIRLSKLPDKQTILAQFVGTLAAPISGVMNVMNGVSRNLVYALTDLKEKKAQAA